MKNCKYKGEKCWEKVNVLVWLKNCAFCEHNAEPLKKGRLIPSESISTDSHGRMFLNGDEI